jgi:hypothetical protein
LAASSFLTPVASHAGRGSRSGGSRYGALRGERDIIRRSPKASRLLLRTALEHGTAGGAKVATVMGHARPDTANVRHVLLAEPHSVRFAGRALLRGPLLRGGGPGREHERQAQERRSGYDWPELWLGGTTLSTLHLISVLVSTVVSTTRASSVAMLATVILPRIQRCIFPNASPAVLGRLCAVANSRTSRSTNSRSARRLRAILHARHINFFRAAHLARPPVGMMGNTAAQRSA